MTPSTREMATTATVCLMIDVLSGHEIFLNSAFTPSKNPVLFPFFEESPIFNSFPDKQMSAVSSLPHPVQDAISTVVKPGFTSSLCVSYAFCRIYNTSSFPFCPDVFFYPLWYCSYAVYIPYMPVLFSYASFHLQASFRA